MDNATLHFAHYEVRRREDGTPWELGRGAMGVTYKAYDAQLRVEVALKVINPGQVGDAKTQALFLREARAAARVHHGNVANVVYLNQDPANPFYAMEFIAGESLRDWLPARGPLAPLLAIGLAQQIALGLEAIHAENVVHRDLKPGNVMIVRASRGREKGASETDAATWQVKIIDFGLARAFAGDALSSNLDALTTGFRGTAVYASPEQCQERVDLDGRSDLYSLGCILWEMLVGAPPFRGGSLHELLTLHVSRPAPVAQLSRLPASLQAVIARLLVKEPEGRFASAAAVVEALERCRERIVSGAEVVDEFVPQSHLETALTAEVPPARRPTVVPISGSASGGQAKPRFTRRALLGGLGFLSITGLVVMAGLIGGWWRTSPSSTEKGPPVAASSTITPAAVPAAPSAPEKSIAVLPFENLSSDQENAFFADGVQDQILTDLSRIADLRVTSRTSVMRYRGKGDLRLREIARELGVTYILEGTVQRSGNKVRVTAQLIDTKTDAHLWADKYDRDLADVFGIQSEVATAIAAQLKAKLTPIERAAIEEKPTTDFAAYDLYLRAKALEQSNNSMMLPATPDNPRQAVRLLEEAVTRDPKFLQAYCLAVRICDALSFSAKGEEAKQYRARAEANLSAAVRLAPAAGDTILAQANHLYVGARQATDAEQGARDFRAAHELLDRALQILPNNAEAWILQARMNRNEGRWDESLDCYRRAHLLSPNDVKIIEEYSFIATYMRRYDLRKALTERGAALTVPPLRWAFEIRGAATEALRAGDNEPEHRVLQRILAENPGTRVEQDLVEHLFATASDDNNAAEMERLAKFFPPPGDLGSRMEAAFRQILIARTRKDEDALLRTVASVLPEMEAAIQSTPKDSSFQAANLIARAGYYCVLVGRKDDGIRWGKRACEMIPISKNSVVGVAMVENLAKIYAQSGENALALDQLELLPDVPGQFHYGWVLADPDWDPLRAEPRFQALLQKMAPKTKKQ